MIVEPYRFATKPTPRWPRRRWPSSKHEARRRWPIIELALVHRVGDLDLGDVSVVIAVSCPHRGQAFEACRWLIDTLKEVVPIWNKRPGTMGNRSGSTRGWAPLDQGVTRVRDAIAAGLL